MIAWSKAQQGEGKTDLVVEVALVFKGAEALTEDFSDEFLGGGLTHAAGDADDTNVETSAPEGSDGLQRLHRVFNAQCKGQLRESKLQVQRFRQIHNRYGWINFIFNQSQVGAVLEGICYIQVTVSSLTDGGDE